jgi:hypothetical protein
MPSADGCPTAPGLPLVSRLTRASLAQESTGWKNLVSTCYASSGSNFCNS